MGTAFAYIHPSAALPHQQASLNSTGGKKSKAIANNRLLAFEEMNTVRLPIPTDAYYTFIGGGMEQDLAVIHCYDSTTNAREILSVRVLQRLAATDGTASPVPTLIIQVLDHTALVIAELSAAMSAEIKIVQVRRP